MKSYIPHRILIINEQICKNEEEKILTNCFQLSFDWANRMGLEGKRVFDLFLQKPDERNYNPMRQQSFLWCKIECTIEERKLWDEQQEQNIQKAVIDALSDE